ncbi:MAG: helix-turn-helix domain-containing protein [Actinomycetota bacterium]|nr:helix-turn-helix domain-containing protein [Actinomycetota bacterium]
MGAETVGRITVTQLDWWNAHSDAFSEAVAVIEWDELHVERRTVLPVNEERPPQRLTMTVEEAAVVLGISRATAYDAVSRGEIPCIRIGRRILIPRSPWSGCWTVLEAERDPKYSRAVFRVV